MYQECKGLANAYIYSDCSSGQGVWYSLQLSLRLDQFMRIKNIPFFVDQPCQKWVFVMHYYLSWVSTVHCHPGEEVIICDCIFCSNSSQWKRGEPRWHTPHMQLNQLSHMKGFSAAIVVQIYEMLDMILEAR